MHILSTFRERTDGPWSHVFGQEKRQEKNPAKLTGTNTCTHAQRNLKVKETLMSTFQGKENCRLSILSQKIKNIHGYTWPSNEMKLKYIVF